MLFACAMTAQCDCGRDLDPVPLLGAILFLVLLKLTQFAAKRRGGVNRMKSSAKIAIVVALGILVVAVVALKPSKGPAAPMSSDPATTGAGQTSQQAGELPRLLDLGRGQCIPCKMMMPVLDGLKKDFTGKLEVEYIDIGEQPEMATVHGVLTIPTQIFFAPDGKELFRHEGYYPREDILAKWKELGYDFVAAQAAAPAQLNSIVREEPAARDARPPETICTLCEQTIDPKTKVTVDAPWGKALLCGVHCYAIYYSSLRDNSAVAGKVAVTDWATGNAVPIEKAAFLYGFEKGGRPLIRAFETDSAAGTEAAKSQGQVMRWDDVLKKEMATRCGFCDRIVYPEDASRVVTAEGLQMCGCCPMCALGIAARLSKDIEVEQKDALTGDTVSLKTSGFKVVSLEPPTAVAWHGQRKGKDGKMASAGCFHQFFFTSEKNLLKWLEQHPEESGKMISIQQALDDKMKLNPQQISNACKIGECK
ncbi:MAG TPA: organomercurial lyase [Candidatus Brocadiia bacterium]|nr:organomercurial lyase [Candidatus Brocadiia bacterium]